MTLTTVRRLPPCSFLSIHLPTPFLASSKHPSEEPSAGINPFSPISFYLLTSLPFLEEEEEEVDEVETHTAKCWHVSRSSKDLLAPGVPEGSKDSRHHRTKPQASNIPSVKHSIKPHSSLGKRFSTKASKDAV